MKKTLVALATLASVSAFAQSSVTIYGSVDGGYRTQSQIDRNGNGSSYFQSGYIKSNRFGFQGTEDMGGGMNSKFRLESNLDATNGAEGGFLNGSNQMRMFDREAWVSMGNAQADLRIGRQYHPVFSAYCMVSTTYCMGGGYANTAAALDWGVNTVGKRWDSMANVNLIANSQFQANIAVSGGASFVSSNAANVQYEPQNSSAGKGQGYNLVWTPAPTTTVVFGSQSAYNTLNAASATGGLGTFGNPTTALIKRTDTVLGASYAINNLTLRATQTSAATDSAVAEKLASTSIGAAYAMGPWEFNYSWSRTKENSAVAAADGTTLKAQIAWAKYNLSKTSFAYFGIDRTAFDTGFIGSTVAGVAATYYGGTTSTSPQFLSASATGATGTQGNSVNGIVFGINKSF